MGHLSHEELVELAEDARPESSVPHLASCEVCRHELDELRGVLSMLTDVDVPEPSPLFWNHLSARVSQAVAVEAAARKTTAPWWAPVLRWRWHMAAGAGMAVLIVAAVLTMAPPESGPKVQGAGVRGAAVLGSGVAGAGTGAGVLGVEPAPEVLELADLADDPSLSLLAELTEDLDWDSATEAGIGVGTGTADRVADELDEGERAELQRLLNDALAGTPVGSTSWPALNGAPQTL